MKILTSFLFLFLLPVCCLAEAPVHRDIDYQVSKILKEVSGIKPGVATRGELLKYFTPQGGLFCTAQRTYVSKRCMCVKVDVKFTLASPNGGPNGLSADVIESISKPYLELPVLD